MKKYSVVLAFVIVFLLGIVVGFGFSKIEFKDKKQSLASNTEVDFSQFAKDENGDEATSQQATESATEDNKEEVQNSTEQASTEEEDEDDEDDEEEQKEKSDAPYFGDFDKEKCAQLNAEREN